MFEDEINSIAFADPDMVRYLLALLPPEAVAGLDTSRLRRLQTKQVGRGARKRVADMAWAVGAPTPENPEAEALLVIEYLCSSVFVETVFRYGSLSLRSLRSLPGSADVSGGGWKRRDARARLRSGGGG